MRKINDFKNNALKVERVPKIFENLNSFETMLKQRKYIKNIFFWIFIVFLYFWIFLKIYQNIGQKLGSNTKYCWNFFFLKNISLLVSLKAFSKTFLNISLIFN